MRRAGRDISVSLQHQLGVIDQLLKDNQPDNSENERLLAELGDAVNRSDASHLLKTYAILGVIV